MNDHDPASVGETHPITPRAGYPRVMRRIGIAALGVGLVAAVAMRFTARPDLWLDEALTVNIAKLPLDQLRNALERDGAPPLYYVLLHGWIRVFGSGSFAVRCLSGIFGVVAIGLAYPAGTRLGHTPSGRRFLGIAAMVVVGASPYAIHYSTEARMYALAMVLVFLAVIVGADAWHAPTIPRLAGIALITSGLLLTLYWSFFLVGVVLVGLAVTAARGVRAARRLLVATIVGCGCFLPWLPTFLSQLAHTGTPWDSPTGPVGGTVKAIVAFGGGRYPEGWAQIGLLIGLAVTAVVAAVVEWRRRSSGRSMAAAVVMVLAAGSFALGIVASSVQGVGFQDRYAAVVFPGFALTVAVGVSVAHDRRARVAVLVVIAGLGLLGGLRSARRVRTPSGAIASQLRSTSDPTDVVAYCPDQLGPSTARLLPTAIRQVTFPDLARPEFVDWTEYAARNAVAAPDRFVRRLLDLAHGARLWLVWSPGYRTLGAKCEAVVNGLSTARRSSNRVRVFAGPDHEAVELRRFDP